MSEQNERLQLMKRLKADIFYILTQFKGGDYTQVDAVNQVVAKTMEMTLKEAGNELEAIKKGFAQNADAGEMMLRFFKLIEALKQGKMPE